MAKFDPTAANIISSLGIKGATDKSGSEYRGYVPVLDENGKLNAQVVPAEAWSLSIPHLSDVVFVDPNTEIDEKSQTGSIASPYSSLSAAARSFEPSESASDSNLERYAAFILAPGEYYDSVMEFSTKFIPTKVFLIGLGNCVFKESLFSVSGLGRVTSSNTGFYFQNITADGCAFGIEANSDATVDVTVIRSHIGYVRTNFGTLVLSADSVVDGSNATNTRYLDDAGKINNGTSSSEALGVGSTVKDAIVGLGSRKIRVLDFSSEDFENSGSLEKCYDVEVSEKDGAYVFDLSGRDKVIVEGLRTLYESRENITATTVTTGSLAVTGKAKIKELELSYLNLGGYKLTIDRYGYLVVVDESTEIADLSSNRVYLQDVATKKIYMLGVENERMYIVPAEESEVSEDAEVDKQLVVYDSESNGYVLSLKNGRLIVEKSGG